MSRLRSLLKILFSSGERVEESPQIDLEALPLGRAAKRLVLGELRGVLTRQLEAADALDDKLKNLLESATLILTIVTTLQIAVGASLAGWLYLLILIVTLGVYAALIVVTLRGLRPMDYHSPIPSTWKEIDERFFFVDEDAALELMIFNYLQYSEKNNAPLRVKARKVRVVSFLLVAIVALLMAMGLLGLGNSVGLPWQTSTPAVPSPTLQLPTPTPSPTIIKPTLQRPSFTPTPAPARQIPTIVPSLIPTISSPIVTPMP